MFSIHTFIPGVARKNVFQIVDMTKYAEVYLSMHFKDLQ